MNYKTVASMSALLTVLTLILTACSPATSAVSTQPPTSISPATPVTTEGTSQETFSDPFAYCTAVGQIDAPDARYTGPLISDALFQDYLKSAGLDPNGDYPDIFKQMTIWRCMDKKVYACNFGANIPCDSKANTDQTPTQAMIDYCLEFPDDDFIPMSVTGHAVIYSWHCVKDTPEILEQIDTVDAAGYQSRFWQLVEPGQ
jgi:hypothetical protein